MTNANNIRNQFYQTCPCCQGSGNVRTGLHCSICSGRGKIIKPAHFGNEIVAESQTAETLASSDLSVSLGSCRFEHCLNACEFPCLELERAYDAVVEQFGVPKK